MIDANGNEREGFGQANDPRWLAGGSNGSQAENEALIKVMVELLLSLVLPWLVIQIVKDRMPSGHILRKQRYSQSMATTVIHGLSLLPSACYLPVMVVYQNASYS